MGVSHQVLLGVEPWSSERAASSLNHGTTAPALRRIFKALVKGENLTKNIIYSHKSALKCYKMYLHDAIGISPQTEIALGKN